MRYQNMRKKRDVTSVDEIRQILPAYRRKKTNITRIAERRQTLPAYRRNETGVKRIYERKETLVAHINPYHRRRPLERDVTTCKTELYRNSFIPSTTVEWNSLPISVQQSTSLSVFKRSLSLSDSKLPAYYYFGERNAQVIHCRLRLEMSNLNNDLFNRHLSTDPKCSCGYCRETAEHYFLHCPNYAQGQYLPSLAAKPILENYCAVT